MKLYFDTSVFVSLVTNEVATPQITTWFSQQDPQNLVASDWNITEFHSAIAFKLRTGQISADLRRGAEALFKRYVEENFAIIAVERSDFLRAAQLAGREELKLRAGDALHLAKIEARGFMLCTLDLAMLGAATVVGIPCLNPLSQLQ